MLSFLVWSDTRYLNCMNVDGFTLNCLSTNEPSAYFAVYWVNGFPF